MDIQTKYEHMERFIHISSKLSAMRELTDELWDSDLPEDAPEIEQINQIIRVKIESLQTELEAIIEKLGVATMLGPDSDGLA